MWPLWYETTPLAKPQAASALRSLLCASTAGAARGPNREPLAASRAALLRSEVIDVLVVAVAGSAGRGRAGDERAEHRRDPRPQPAVAVPVRRFQVEDARTLPRDWRAHARTLRGARQPLRAAAPAATAGE